MLHMHGMITDNFSKYTDPAEISMIKYLVQFGIIFLASFLGELLYTSLDIPIPGNILGMLLLLLFLLTGLLKLSMIEDVSNFMLNDMIVSHGKSR